MDREKVIQLAIITACCFISIASITYAFMMDISNSNMKKDILEWKGSLFDLQQKVGK